MRFLPILLLLACNGGDDGDKTTPVDKTVPDTGPEDTGPVGTTGDDDDDVIEDNYNDKVPPLGALTVTGFKGGAFEPLPAFATSPVQGNAQLVHFVDGTSQVSVAASGLTASTPHNVHVHTWPCSYEAGGHYKLDPGIEETVETNEIWPAFTSDADGRGWAYIDTSSIRGDALSVIIHDPASGDKLACADLTPSTSIGSKAIGTLAPFAYYETEDETIGGTVEVTYSSSSKVYVSATGLNDGTQYKTHLHALPCDTLDGGGHYKLDPSVVDTIDTNEVWPVLTPSGGSASTEVTVSGHMIREDAQAVVIHRVAGVDVPKVACATLQRQSWNDRLMVGAPVNLSEANARGLTIEGRGTLNRRKDGVSVGFIELYGLPPNAVATVHLHDAPCDVLDGGSHYYVDRATPDVGEANELWIAVKPGNGGYATRSVGIPHVVRADAHSFVVHADDGARLACIDLK
jgi:hypothetical protein